MVVKMQAQALIAAAEKALAQDFEKIDAIAYDNQKRVLQAFQSNRLTEEHFVDKTGYGLDHVGREVIDRIFALVMQAEAAAMRLQFVSGTHAIACALLGNLSSGDRLVSLTGKPYDTMREVIGMDGDIPGSLVKSGVQYLEYAIEPGSITQNATQYKLAELLAEPTRVAYIQKSCGYSFERRTLSNAEITGLCQAIRAIDPRIKIIVDNCYGEFVEDQEPTNCGADLVAGSLIKNPGGGLAITGGYIAGRKDLVEGALTRLTAPGIGGHLGLLYGQGRLVLQGLFLAPAFVANAVKGVKLVSYVLSELGFRVKPQAHSQRYDIVQAIEFGSEERLLNFCRAVQKCAPVNAHVLPTPADMPGYRDKVVMAGGTFIEGATLELSADAPLRPPYVAYMQGGLTYYHVKFMVEQLLESI